MTIFALVSSEPINDKSSKHFSLFSVVTFQNTECTSETSVSGGATHGTCFTSTECTDKGGMQSGNCASGFGVCCVFLNTGGATSTITENRTRLRNSEFPSTATAATATTIAYTVNKMSSDICQLRLDFTTFIIAGPSNTVESIPAGAGTNCQDTLVITTTDVTAWTSTPTGTLCGTLSGEHLYVDLTHTAADAATITLSTIAAVTPAVGGRMWDIKTSQIECFATYRAPQGCQRFFTEDTGKIISYNFARVTGAPAPAAGPSQNSGLELPLQNVNTCIRRAKNMCCVEYQPCASYAGIALADATHTGGADEGNGDVGVWNEAWSLDLLLWPYIEQAEQANLGMIDSQCLSDYVEIPSSWSASCGAGTSSMRGTINTRYCGARLGYNGQRQDAIGSSTPVCDCSEPFLVTHKSDDSNDKGGIGGLAIANTNTLGLPRGFCLDYRQVPCWQ